MRVGKVPPELLERLVYPHLGRRPEVLVRAGIGEDCAVVDFGEWVCVLTTDPITGAVRRLGRIAVYVATNDLGATGAEPVALLMDVLLREGASEEELRQLMEDAGRTAAELGAEIVGGHTEVTAGLARTLVVTSAVGRARKDAFVTSAGARPGDTLVLTKAAGLEGTAILAADYEAHFRRRLGEDLVRRAQGFLDEISVVREGRAAVRAGARAMHDATEGGVLAAVAEMARASGVGVELYVDRVPVRAETDAVCSVVGIDPLGLVSSGALLVATPVPERTLAALVEAGVPAAVVGKFVDNGNWKVSGCARQPLEPYPVDELWRALERLESEAAGGR
ncbi:MAG: AIR synthase family protein [Armatimonadota bacterium]|nr:AIR synthase family protein [Armatimonadota bacterium]MDR5697447.1 AIR synthase family protein [Armatimonadota bacterium]